LKAVDASVEEAARNLGASRWRALRTVMLPLVLPSIVSGALLVFIEALEISACVRARRGQADPLRRDLQALRRRDRPEPGLRGVLAVLLIAATTLVLLVQRRFLGRRRFATGARRSAPVIDVGPSWRIAASLLCWAVVVASLIPSSPCWRSPS